jgi:ribosome assembly protein YihI (activator of Der GTPase)
MRSNSGKSVSEEIIEKVQELIEKGNGDTERLNNILNSLQNGNPLDFSDQQYI